MAVVAGAGDSCKSWLCLYLAVMTAAGREAVAAPDTHAPLRQGPVLYVTAENAIAEEQRRCQLLKAGLTLSDDLPIYFVAADGLSLDRDADYQRIVALVEQYQPGALFIDSAIALSGLENENDNAAVRRFMQTRILPFARRHRVTVYVIQHSPKPSLQPGQRMTDEHVARGASDWRNAADVLLYLRRDPSLGERAVVLRCAKQRIGRKPAPIWFTLDDVADGPGVALGFGGRYSDTGQAIRAELQKAIAHAVALLRATPAGVWRQDLLDAVEQRGSAKATTRRALDVLRGKQPWLDGPYRGTTHKVVTDDKAGKQVFLVFQPAEWPSDEDWDER